MTDSMKVEAEPRTQIDIPDLDNLEPWLEKYVTEPDVSYSGDPDPNHYLTPEKALEMTRDQFRLRVRDREVKRSLDNQRGRQLRRPYLTKPQFEKNLRQELIEIVTPEKSTSK